MRAKAVPLAQRKPVQATRLRQGDGLEDGKKKRRVRISPELQDFSV